MPDTCDTLPPFAARRDNSRGRCYPEEAPSYRSEFQRDRDRIVHCGAFRRLEYKTQVFVNHEGDMFRTRLTHSIEVAQISRSIARALSINEDLTESIALAHDLGHPPFGHAGQDALNACMRDYRGFEHNLQSLRIVDSLEKKYAGFDGLNLTFETREGILKHCSRQWAMELGELGQRFLSGQQPSLEAQLANLADEIAYNNHDVDDGLRAGLIEIDELMTIELFHRQYEAFRRRHPDITGRRVIHETIRRMINEQVVDLIENSRRQIAAAELTDIDSVRALQRPLIGFTEDMQAANLELKQFLRRRLYQHYRVRRMSAKAQRIIQSLFEAFINDPGLLPDETQQQQARCADDTERVRVIADYIAGMTDRYAISEYQRLFDPMQLT